jgi:ABC-type glycerol-3-phosphate transport system substrate-binding protein
MPLLRRFAMAGLSLALAACRAAPLPASPAPAASATFPATAAPAVTVTPASEANHLRLWLPPGIAPVSSPSAEEALAEQIAQFGASHPGVVVEIRLKSASGVGGLLNALATAYNAAPAVLPDLVALTRDDLATAAAAGLVLPLEEVVPPEVLADYYPFAQAMGRPNGELVGLPFAVDARVLAYDTEIYPTAPLLWSDLTAGPLVLPGGEAAGFTVLHQYLALGGTLAEASGKTALDPGLLAQALTFFADLQRNGLLSPEALTYTDPAATWQVFRERRAPLAVTSAQWFMAERLRVAGASASYLPTSDGSSLALADGWCWALVNTAPEHRTLARELLLWLSDAPQLGRWTLAERVLPPRASALAAWGAAPLAPFASAVLTHAQLQPSAEVLAVVGPALRQALDDVLNNRLTPLAAAAQAAQTVSGR